MATFVGSDFLPLGASFRRLNLGRFTLWGPAVIDGSFQASCAFQNLEASEKIGTEDVPPPKNCKYM